MVHFEGFIRFQRVQLRNVIKPGKKQNSDAIDMCSYSYATDKTILIKANQKKLKRKKTEIWRFFNI